MQKIDVNFPLKDENGNDFKLIELRGEKILIFAYPKDGTPGCTLENREFSENLDEFLKLGINVVGVSRDSAKKHQKFCQNHNLKIKLISDEKMEFLNHLGIVVEKSMFGKKYKTNERTTFLIDKNTGEILEKWEKVNPIGHVKNVLEKLKENLKK